ncbi:hypothetical protein [Mesorhizobium caraganae]|uniref:hypothetical protein n=1 Tax=Mesorhizobium caraganae TaxID=483206 RepID=UPI00333A9362
MTDSAFSKALITIDWEDADPRAIRCPVTGAIVAAGYDPATGEFTYDEEPKWGEIPTVLFHHTDEGGFEFVRPDLQAKIDQARHDLLAAGEDEDELDDFNILAEHLDPIGKVPLVFEIVTQGMAYGGGPLTSTVYVGLDLAVASSELPTSRLIFDGAEDASELATARLIFDDAEDTSKSPPSRLIFD